MKKFIDLRIKCDFDESSLFVLSTIKEYCETGSFIYSKELESQYECNDHTLRIKTLLANIPTSMIILYAHDDIVQIVNIVPIDKTTSILTKEQYNSIVRSFSQDIIIPLFENKFIIDVSKEDVDIKEIIPKSYNALYQWVNCPGAPNNPFSHYNDLHRWFNFICQLHDSEENLSSGDLEQWLSEDNGWPEEIVTETIIRFETETDLLNYYDSH